MRTTNRYTQNGTSSGERVRHEAYEHALVTLRQRQSLAQTLTDQQHEIIDGYDGTEAIGRAE